MPRENTKARSYVGRLCNATRTPKDPRNPPDPARSPQTNPRAPKDPPRTPPGPSERAPCGIKSDKLGQVLRSEKRRHSAAEWMNRKRPFSKKGPIPIHPFRCRVVALYEPLASDKKITFGAILGQMNAKASENHLGLGSSRAFGRDSAHLR